MASKVENVSEVSSKKPLPAILIGLLVGLAAGAAGFGLGCLLDGSGCGLAMGVTLGVMTIAFTTLGIACDREERRSRAAWETVSQGTFDRVEYVPRGRYHHLATVIHFDDGRACVLTDKSHDIGFPRGTKIEVKKNGLNDYRIEVLK